MKNTRTGPVVGILASLLASGTALAAPGDDHAHGDRPEPRTSFPQHIDELPMGRFRSQIGKLPADVQDRVFERLQRLGIHTPDYEFINVDPEGAIYYSDTELPPEPPVEEGAAAEQGAPEPLAVAPEETFFLHSRPGASKTVFLDFDGHTISGTAWSSGTLYARPYDTDGNAGSFSDTERANIAEIWHRFAEDMAPFDIDVTTEDPGGFGPTTGHVLITTDTDERGAAMPAQGAGGVAYVDVWGRSNYSYYQPALVYANRLSGHSPYIAEAATHEFGHNLGLGHDGSSSSSYYRGHGTGNVSWGSIMGVGYYSNVTQWSKGEYAGANNTQDDLNIISGLLSYRADDHGNTSGAATGLAVDADGLVYVTSPENDPQNLDTVNKGVIETRTDVDMFWFDTAAGAVSFSVTPAWEAFYRSSLRGANLDIKATLYDASGKVVASSDPLNDTHAQLDVNVAAGRYYLAVTGVGNTDSPYSDYGSLGMYFVSGSVQAAGGDGGDTTAPNPDPMGWTSAPAAVSASQINMQASTATDESGGVQYFFQCTAGGASGCVGSGWQSGTSYSATGLSPSTSYSYQVKARDAAGNETGWSPTRSATTASGNQLPVANDDAATTAENQSVTIAVLNNDTDADGDSLSIASYGQGRNGSVTQSGSRLVYTPANGFSGSDSFTYTVTDGVGEPQSATVSVTVSSANQLPVATDDAATTPENQSVTIAVLNNDTDADGDSLSIASYGQGSNGSVTQSGSRLVYTPANGFSGSDSFAYTVTDGEGTSNSATVSITVVAGDDDNSGSNTAPEAMDDNAEVGRFGSVVIAVLSNDSDADGDMLTIDSWTQGRRGYVEQVGNELVYNRGYRRGDDSFTYTVSDGRGGVSEATVNIDYTRSSRRRR